MTRLRLATLALLALAGAALAQEASIAPIAPGDTLRDAAGAFTVDLSVEPLAGQTLQAGTFTVEFLGNVPAGEPPGPAIFADGFDLPAGATR